MPQIRVGIIGFGKLGQALAKGLMRTKRFSVSGSVRSSKRAQELSKQWDLSVVADNMRLARNSDVLILAVKPSQARNVVEEMRSSIRSTQVLISVAASIQLKDLQKWSGNRCAIFRAMPNLPSLIQEGMTVITPSRGKTVKGADILTREIFTSLGDVIVLEESHFDAVTALSACGPAFIFTIIESLIEAGVKVGLPRDISRALTLQTMIGSAQMVKKQAAHPASLKDLVTTPAGCTIDGLVALEEGKLRATLMRAIQVSTKRSAQLRKK